MADKPYAQAARSKVDQAEAAAKAAKKQESEDRVRRYDARLAELRDGGIEKIFEGSWKKTIDEAAERGKREAQISIGDNEGELYHWRPEEDALVRVGIEYLIRQGFNATSRESYSPRCGSDDPYGNRTHLYIEVSW